MSSAFQQGKSNHIMMSSSPPIRNPPVLSFLESTRAYYSRQGNPPDSESADGMLNRDIENYESYLASRGARWELSQFNNLTRRIREDPHYRFKPPVQFPAGPTMSFTDFLERNSALGPEYQHPLIFDTYAKYIASVASASTVAMYAASREEVAEGDRRWLYKLSRNHLGPSISTLQIARSGFREVFERTGALPVTKLTEPIRKTCQSRISQLTFLIATEMVLPQAELEAMENEYANISSFLSVGSLPPRSKPRSRIPPLSLGSPIVPVSEEAPSPSRSPIPSLSLGSPLVPIFDPVQRPMTTPNAPPNSPRSRVPVRDAEGARIENMLALEFVEELRDKLTRDDASSSDDENEIPLRDDSYNSHRY
ncbi:hypothetical protein DL95DRAFT_402050 [Leptodontidium sp. 2 PMI_412]|nr:hypothetical protein DL95DRAFT_402050 [Leptodontidium sp. 2 PMI_412]